MQSYEPFDPFDLRFRLHLRLKDEGASINSVRENIDYLALYVWLSQVTINGLREDVNRLALGK